LSPARVPAARDLLFRRRVLDADGKDDDVVLRISSRIEAGTRVHLKLEGNITGEWVELLQEECRRHLDAREALELDLAGVGFVDRAGVALVRWLLARHVRLVGASSLVDTLLSPERGS
jgi:ABC-type transporter Mla MlaB component